MLAIFIPAGGFQFSLDLGVGAGISNAPYHLRVWITSYKAMHPEVSSFFIKQDLETLAATLAKKQDQHGNLLKTQIYRDKHILIIQESEENGINYYLVTPNPDIPSSEAERITRGAYMYLLYIPWGRFCEANSNQYKLVFPYHLLNIRNVKPFVYGETFSASENIFDLLADWDDLYTFYMAITSYQTTRPDEKTIAVYSPNGRFGLRITLKKDGESPRIRFVPEYPQI